MFVCLSIDKTLAISRTGICMWCDVMWCGDTRPSQLSIVYTRKVSVYRDLRTADFSRLSQKVTWQDSSRVLHPDRRFEGRQDRRQSECWRTNKNDVTSAAGPRMREWRKEKRWQKLFPWKSSLAAVKVTCTAVIWNTFHRPTINVSLRKGSVKWKHTFAPEVHAIRRSLKWKDEQLFEIAGL